MKKVVVLPHELYESLSRDITPTTNTNTSTTDTGTTPPDPPTAEHGRNRIKRLEDELRTILEDKRLHMDEKRVLYQETLQNLIHEYEESKEPRASTSRPDTEEFESINQVTVSQKKAPEAEDDDPFKQILNSTLPKAMKNVGLFLYKTLQKSTSIGWNAKGEVLLNGHIIDGSNIIDIITGLSRKIKKAPVGWGRILPTLKSLNIPHSLIQNPARLDEIRAFTPSSQIHSSERDSVMSDNRINSWLMY